MTKSIGFLYLTFCALCYFISCSSTAQISNSGKVLTRFEMYDTSIAKKDSIIYSNDTKIWFQDSLAIEEITSFQIDEDSEGNITTKTVVLGYIYINAVTNSYYCYKTFTDTASILKKSNRLDSITSDRGWNFFSPREFQYTGSPKNIGDTIIDKIMYNRLLINRVVEGKKFTNTCYFRCDKKGSILTYSDTFKNFFGCPMTRVDEIPFDKNQNPNSLKFIYMSDSLTKEEVKVFKAWIKNEEKNAANR